MPRRQEQRAVLLEEEKAGKLTEKLIRERRLFTALVFVYLYKITNFATSPPSPAGSRGGETSGHKFAPSPGNDSPEKGPIGLPRALRARSSALRAEAR